MLDKPAKFLIKLFFSKRLYEQRQNVETDLPLVVSVTVLLQVFPVPKP